MDNMCASDVNLLPEKSRLSQTNTAMNKVNLIPSHYPPPEIPDPQGRLYDADLMLSQPFPVTFDLERKSVVDQSFESQDSTPPPLPPREPTGCTGGVICHQDVPVPLCPGVRDRNQILMVHPIGQADNARSPDNVISFELNKANVSFECFESLVNHGPVQPQILLNPVIHSHALKQTDTGDVTHHCWNVLNKDLSGCMTNHMDNDKHCDGLSKMTPNVQSTVLNQVIPLSRWPIGSRQPETHFVLDRVIARPQAGNEYVDSPLHTTNKDSHTGVTSKRTNTATIRLESSIQDCSTVVTTQPTPSSGKLISADQDTGKDDKKALSPRHPPCKEGLICSRCGKCRCLSCTQPRQLPRCWVGPSFYQYECSAQQVVDVCSCLCCVQALFYHCLYHPDDVEDIATEPFACCEGPRCCLRWMILGLLVPCLPCLCLYYPLQCGIDACTSCYNGCSQRGCHCGYNVSSSGSSTTRDLLLDSEPSST